MIAIPGSIRPGSLNARLLEAAARAVGEAMDDYARLTVYPQERLAALPLFSPETGIPEAVQALSDAVEDADALVVATPEYNGSIPACLKNAIDWLSVSAKEVLRGKPAAVIAAGRDAEVPVRAQHDARRVLDCAGADVVSAELAIGEAEQAFDLSGRLTDRRHVRRLGRVLGELFARARAARAS